MARWETPASIDEETICITVQAPKNLFKVVMSAIQALGDDWNWGQFEDTALDVNTVADRFKQMALDTVISDCEVPDVRLIGETIMWPTNAAAPDKWLKCLGQAVSRATYADLFGVIGVKWGSGDGSTTFNLPNFIFRSPMGAVDALVGQQSGEMEHTLTASEMPAHTHGLVDSQGNVIRVENGASSQLFGIRRVAGLFNTGVVVPLNTQSSGSGAAHNNLHPVNFVGFLIYAGVS